MIFKNAILTAALALAGLAAAPANAQAPGPDALAAQVAANPADVDARLRLALALAAADRRDEAEAEFSRVIAQAPDYWDAYVGLARIAYWRGDVALARRRLAPALQARPDDPEARALAAQLASAQQAEPGRWRLDATVAGSELSRGLQPWREASVSLSRPLAGQRDYLAASVQAAERFDRTDVYLEGLYGVAVGAGGEAYLALGGTPDADFRPEVQVRAGVAAPLNGAGLSGALDVALSRFPTDEIAAVRGTLSQRLADRLTLAASLIVLKPRGADTLTGYALRGDFDATERLRFTVGFSDAPETSEGVPVDVRAAAGGVRYTLGDGRAFGLNVTREDRGAYERTEVALSTTMRF